MDGPNPGKGYGDGLVHRCTGHNRAGGQCERAAVPGATVCVMHGGKAPQVQRKARLRLAELVDPAIATLAREMATADTSRDRQSAANSILDRAGLARTQRVEGVDARAILLERLLDLAGEQLDESAMEPPPAIEA